MAQPTESRPPMDAGALSLLQVFRSAAASEAGLTRADVGERTGWARVTVNSRLDALVDAGLLTEAGLVVGSRGRPATRFRFDPTSGQLLVADVGASGMRLAVCDLAGTVLAREDTTSDVAAGPDAVLGTALDGLTRLRAQVDGAPVWGVGVSLPGPVEAATGRIVSPPIMTGWDGVAVPPLVQRRFPVPVLVENDVNAMAAGERAAVHTDVDDLLFLKVGTGVGTGIISNGRVVRGAQGAAGDLGHTWADAGPDESLGATARQDGRPLCRCGKVGCLEAYASGWALVEQLARAGSDVRSVDDLVLGLRAGDWQVVAAVRAAGRILGAAVAHTVSLLNPSVIVVGGQLAVGGEHLLAGIRERIASRSLPLATRDLRICRSELDGDAGVLGLAHGIADRVLGERGSLGAAAGA
ncbi:ROK family protein [Geodermatophilus sp. SYSU D01119]